MEMEKDHYAM